jgi:hypothetical protein
VSALILLVAVSGCAHSVKILTPQSEVPPKTAPDLIVDISKYASLNSTKVLYDDRDVTSRFGPLKFGRNVAHAPSYCGGVTSPPSVKLEASADFRPGEPWWALFGKYTKDQKSILTPMLNATVGPFDQVTHRGRLKIDFGPTTYATSIEIAPYSDAIRIIPADFGQVTTVPVPIGTSKLSLDLEYRPNATKSTTLLLAAECYQLLKLPIKLSDVR